MKFESNLCYCNPAHGGWGIIRVAALIPEAYLLFVCPSACFRHGALGAIQHKYKNRISYIYISENDIVEGYDQCILDGVDELLVRTNEKIRLLFIYVSCLDDFIGTDLDKVTAKLASRYPAIHFRAARMNPIAVSTKLPPAVTTFDAMMSVLPGRDELDHGISLWGNFVDVPQDNELIRELEHYGHEIRQLSSCSCFEDYLKMSQSYISIVFKPFVNYALTRLEKRTGATHISMLISYDIDEIRDMYKKLSDALGEDILGGLESDLELTEKTVAKVVAKVGDKPVFISDSATVFPFKMADALLRYGFNVRRIYAAEITGIDSPYADKISAEHPEIEIIQADHPKAVWRDILRADAISVGEEAAYLSNSKYVADINNDEGMFGLQGVRKLMECMSDAVDSEADVRKLIEEYGGIV